MARPVGVTVKTKDNSRKKFREREQWLIAKKLGRPAQQFNAETNCSGDGNRINFYTERTKPLSEVTANDVPRGLDPDDVAIDRD